MKKWDACSYNQIEKSYLFSKGLHRNFFDDGFVVDASRGLGKTAITSGFLIQQATLFARLTLDDPFARKRQTERRLKTVRFRLREVR